MPHTDVRNLTPFAYEPLVVTDEDGVPQFVPLVQASFSIEPDGRLVLLEEQPAPNIAGEWYGDPASSSLRVEPQIAFAKAGTDIVLRGHAYAPNRGATETQVGIRVGSISKLARVVGDRLLVRRSGETSVARPLPFEKIPLTYERAFGGWDRRDPDPARHRFEMRNPVGVGFRADTQAVDDELRLPNIEHADQSYALYGDMPPPAGFGFVGPNWQPRLALAGTYDAAWTAQRKPLLPRDFDRRFFNAASPGLISETPLAGNEPVVVIGASSRGRLAFSLPAVSPECVVELRGRSRTAVQSQLDTVVVDTDVHVLTLLWRASVPVRNGMHDVVSLEVHTASAAHAGGILR